MRTFLSPAERRVLDSLPANEREVVEALMQEFDAHLVEDEAPVAMDQPTLFDQAA